MRRHGLAFAVTVLAVVVTSPGIADDFNQVPYKLVLKLAD